MHASQLIAKTALVSSLITITILMGLLYLFRDPLVTYLLNTSVATVGSVSQSDQDSPEPEPVVAVVTQAKPAVVSVIATKDVPVFERYFETIQPWGFFGGFTIPRLRENGFEEQEVGGGSGFIVSRDGHLVTNYHVVADETARYSVLLDDGSTYPITILDSDPGIDIAIAKIDTTEERSFPVVAFGDSTSLQLGQTVVAIGNALAEFQNSVSVGVVSGLGRSIVASDAMGQSEELHQIIQTDAAINPGNSGGPLLSLSGEVMGVNVATTRGADNIGFAIPAELVSHVVSSVIETGEIVRPYLGVRYVTVNERIAEANNLPIEYGVLVISGGSAELPAVLPDSPAAKAGILEGDVIVAIDGDTVRGGDLGTILRTKPIGVPFAVEILRAGEYRVVEVTLEAF